MNTKHKDKYSLFGKNRYGFCKENCEEIQPYLLEHQWCGFRHVDKGDLHWFKVDEAQLCTAHSELGELVTAGAASGRVCSHKRIANSDCQTCIQKIKRGKDVPSSISILMGAGGI